MTDNLPDEMKIQLVANVTLRDPVTGRPVMFGPDSEDVPKWARDQIGKHLWGYRPPKQPPTAHVDVASEAYIDVVCHHTGDHPKVRFYGEGNGVGSLVARFERSVITDPAQWLWVAGMALPGHFGQYASTDPEHGNTIDPTLPRRRPGPASRRRSTTREEGYEPLRIVRTTGPDGDRVQLWCPACKLGPKRGLWESWAGQLEALYAVAVRRVPTGAPSPTLVASYELAGLAAKL